MDYKEKYNEALELAESKDEKMKKAIMHILYENYTDAAVIEGVEIAEIVTWLEEQSKKKSADEVLKIRQELYQSGYNDGYKHGQEDTTISLEKESIEVDERMRKGIIRNLQYLMDRSEGFVKEDLQERIAWLEKQGEQKTDPCTDCTNDKGCVTCEHGELRETHTRTLDSDKVIEWLVANICNFEYFVKWFKQDFGL